MDECVRGRVSRVRFCTNFDRALLDQALTEYYPKYILYTTPSAQGTNDLSRNEYALSGESRNLKKR